MGLLFILTIAVSFKSGVGGEWLKNLVVPGIVTSIRAYWKSLKLWAVGWYNLAGKDACCQAWECQPEFILRELYGRKQLSLTFLATHMHAVQAQAHAQAQLCTYTLTISPVFLMGWKKLHFIFLYTCGTALMLWCVKGDQRIIGSSWFFPSTVQITGTKFQLSSLAQVPLPTGPSCQPLFLYFW